MANNYKVKMVDLQNKYKFKIFCSSQMYDDTDLKREVEAIYKAFPKASGTGTDASLDGTAAALMNIDLKGNTSQYNTTGKNLLPNERTTTTENGITITKNDDGTYKVNGTATADVSLAINVDTFIPMSGTWRLLGCPSGGSASTYMLSAYVGYWGTSSPNIETGSGTNITYTGDVKARFYIKSGTTCNNLIFKPMITTDTTATIDNFEPYTGGTASPNPSYPQDVNVVTGDNTINICGKNLFNKSTITTSAYLKEDGTLQTGTGAEYVTSDFIPVQPNTTYYKTQTLSPRTKFYDANKQVLNNTTYQDVSIGGNAGSFTTPNNAYYFRFTGNVNTSTGININSVMVHKGSTATTFEPYQSQSYSINLGSLELCKIGDYQDYIYKEGKKWYKYKTIDKVVLNGTQNIPLASGTPRRFNATYTALGIDNVKSGSTALETQNNYRMCDHFDYTSGVNTWGMYYLHNNWLVMLDGESVIATANDLKNWLASNPTTIYYVLATPTTEEITDATLISQLEALRNAESYEGQTNISQTNNDLPFIITASAIKDLSNL